MFTILLATHGSAQAHLNRCAGQPNRKIV